MSTYFDWLPEELLIEIFIHVNNESIKNLIEISPFNSLISKCSSWRNIFRIAFPEVDILDVLNLKNNIYNHLHAYYKSRGIYRYLFKYNLKIESTFPFDGNDDRCILGLQVIIMERFLSQLEQFLSDEEIKYITHDSNTIDINLIIKTDLYFINIDIAYLDHRTNSHYVTTSRHPLTRKQFFNLLFLRDYCME